MESYRRKRDAGAGAQRRLPGILMLLAVTTVCISWLLPTLVPVPQDLEPLRMQLVQGSSNLNGSIQYVDAGGDMEIVIGVDGENVQLRTDCTNVKQALNQAGVELGADDLLSCEPEDPVYAGMEVTVTRVTYETVVQDELLRYTIQEIPNDRMMVGQSIVRKEGINGTVRESWKIRYHDGVEVDRTLVNAETIKTMSEAVVEVGTYVLPTVNEEAKTLTFDDGTVLNYSKKLTVGATAYSCEGKSFNITYTGTTARVGAIAVDPRTIPLNSKLYVQAPDGTWFYGICTAEDTGGKIKGNRIDLYFDTIDECFSFGYRKALVYIIEE